MFKDISDAISIQLNNEFGNGYEVYGEDVEQDLQEPCFFIKPLKIINTPLLGKRKKRTYPFVITYFPVKGNEEMMEFAEKLMDVLEFITLVNGDIVRAFPIECEIVDGLLHCNVSYRVILNSYVKEESMDEIDHETKIKG